MSYSFLVGIKKDYTAEIIHDYKNSWLFSPIIWDVLIDKYIRDYARTPYGYNKSFIGIDGKEVWLRTNEALNESSSLSDRICWELSNQQILFAKDKHLVAKSIMDFVSQNRGYDRQETGLYPLDQVHIVSRFMEISNDIAALDENMYPYFLLKNNSTDDTVENWFSRYDKKKDETVAIPLYEQKEKVTEFVVIGKEKLRFISNLDFQY